MNLKYLAICGLMAIQLNAQSVLSPNFEPIIAASNNATVNLTTETTELIKVYNSGSLVKPPSPVLSDSGTALYKSIGLLYNDIKSNPSNPQIKPTAIKIKQQLAKHFEAGQLEEFNFLAWLYLTYIPENNPVVVVITPEITSAQPILNLVTYSTNRRALANNYSVLFGANPVTAKLIGGSKGSPLPPLTNFTFLKENYALEYVSPATTVDFLAFLKNTPATSNAAYLPSVATTSELYVGSANYTELKNKLLTSQELSTNGWIGYMLHTLVMLEKFQDQIKNPQLRPVVSQKSTVLTDIQARLKNKEKDPTLVDRVEPLINKTAEYALARVIPTIQERIAYLMANSRYDEADFLITLYLNIFKGNQVLLQNKDLLDSLGNLLDNTSLITIQGEIAKFRAKSDQNLAAMNAAFEAKQFVDALQYMYNARSLYPSNTNLYELPLNIKATLYDLTTRVLVANPGKLKSLLVQENNNVLSSTIE